MNTLPLPAPIPTSGYDAWFLNRDEELFSLPVVALVAEEVFYGTGVEDEQPSIEWEPAVLNVGGSLVATHEATRFPGIANGLFVGILRSKYTAELAEEILEATRVVMPGLGGNFASPPKPEEMCGRVTAAKIRLGELDRWVA